jgi:glutamyl-tRNA synthetase
MNVSGVRVRFAPSPTGPLHAGSVRTALLNWMFARASQGVLLLRIDDTDEQRSLPEYEDEIIAGLRRLGLEWDEGPLRQSQRSALYGEALERLRAAGAVEERDGAVEFAGRVIARADGTPLYHLATAVDEIEDKITHVLRGRDHTSNTELQTQLIEALGSRPPQYVHAPLLLGADGAKLSKRAGGEGDAATAVTVAGLLDAGITADAICNALALSLAEFGEPEVMTRDELPARFDLARLHRADAQFDHDKLLWLSGRHIRRMSGADFAACLQPFLAGFQPTPLAIEAAQTAAPTLRECAVAARELLEPPSPDETAAKLLAAPEASELLRVAAGATGALPPGGIDEARATVAGVKSALKQSGLPVGQGLRTLRAALSGRTEGPELPYVLATTSEERLRGLL